MSVRNIVLFLFLGFCQTIHGKHGYKGEQEWGFVNVRPGAHIFYWLHYTTAKVSSYTEKPLIIWLEGGPGTSSTGYTNFKEIGPLDLNGKNRSSSLVKNYNILFIDSPVGTGFSYTDSNDELAKTDKKVAIDLVTFIEQFFKKYPTLSKVPTYIVGQCYGGKIAVLLAFEWLQKIQNGWNITNFKGVGLSSAWISPIQFVLSWAPYLYQKGLIDNYDYKIIKDGSYEAYKCSRVKDWKCVHEHTQFTIHVIKNITKNVNFYNIHSKLDHQDLNPYVEDEDVIKSLMETEVKSTLNLPENSYFNIDGSHVYQSLSAEILKPVTEEVEYLLKQAGFKVFVFNGQWDLLVNDKGASNWLKNLKWENLSKWLRSNSKPLVINGSIMGYVKAYKNLRMYWVNRAGHMITIDNPVATRKILKDLTSEGSSN